jgi:hypothetical protein
MALPKSRKTLTREPKRPRSGGRTLVKEFNPLQRPRDSMRPGTYREATDKRALKHRASIEILLCRIMYFMAGTGLLEDSVNGDAQRIKKRSRCKDQLGAHPVYNQSINQ